MANEDVPQQYWNSLLALTTKASAESEKRDVTPRPMSDEDLVKEADPGRQMDAILQSLHSYASSPADLNETDLGKIEELTDHLEDILGYAEITNRFVGKGGLLVIETFLAQRHHLFLQCRFAELVLSLTENNPSTQSLFTREGLLVKMLKLLEDDSYSENDGPRILSNIVRKARNGKLAGKSARVMTSIAYTLEDSRMFQSMFLTSNWEWALNLLKTSHAKRLTVDIMSNFLYVLRSFPSDCGAELEYIGDYVLASVDPKDIPSEILDDVVTCLKGRQVRISTAEDLVKKLSPT
ncbi:unnamed protein product [Haemonchus placei]|uniref:Nucleotide exchange factor SIL1 n=1 Tax=Haemonchus placei TaxID=6290 RepID=A0A0N4X0Z0_HAEPC|nr:unnamed protein product [Haemonchus placei]